jgi:hypothetical protein
MSLRKHMVWAELQQHEQACPVGITIAVKQCLGGPDFAVLIISLQHALHSSRASLSPHLRVPAVPFPLDTPPLPNRPQTSLQHPR